MLHAKLVIIDGEIAEVGAANYAKYRGATSNFYLPDFHA
ncbi:hypothetical protein ACFX4I_23085 [Peribacillus sp. YIM B13472]